VDGGRSPKVEHRVRVMQRIELGAKLLLLLAALIVGFIMSEAAAQIYVAKIAKQGKLFAFDGELGWIPISNLKLERNNADGDPWRIVTDANGVRGPGAWQPDKTRLLMVGDSFVFGEGVNIEDRFDTLLGEAIPELSIVNIGVMGYGPDQQLIRARRWTDQLRAGDVLVMVTYGNDFFDISRPRHSGRAKPWIEEIDGRMVVHGPDFSMMDLVREHSYILYTLAREMTPGMGDDTKERLASAGELYQKWVLEEVRPLLDRGVRVLIVHHGDRQFELPFDVDAVFASTCDEVTGCLALDPVFGALPREAVFLQDGHWNAGGHRLAAEELARYLRSNPSIAARPPDRTAVD
jgi:hypothetical protein